MKLNLSDLETLCNKGIVAFDYPVSMKPKELLALIRIAKAIEQMNPDHHEWCSSQNYMSTKECDCGYAELKEALEGVE